MHAGPLPNWKIWAKMDGVKSEDVFTNSWSAKCVTVCFKGKGTWIYIAL